MSEGGRQPRGQHSRAISAAEFFIGAFVVIGYNVLRILPNEVPILFAAGLVSVRLRDGSWAAMGLRRPVSWIRAVIIAVVAAALRIGLGEFVIDPITARYWAPAAAPSGVEAITGNLSQALKYLLLVWTFAAFGEEIAYRGYLLTRAADLGKRSLAAYWVAMILVAVLFGYGHFYKGPAGIVDSGAAGLILGAAYMLSGRNLWASILAHGLIDTVGICFLYFGWES
jgi:membrane protease YdiL (CAAX protease family)